MRYPIDQEKLQSALDIFVGTHDFRSFCKGTEMGENTVRTIRSITVTYARRYGAWCIEFKGPGFMRHMIRRIVGACLQVAARKDLSITYVKEVLEQKNPRQKLINAPAKGLCLYKICYF
jgi:tRNA pseudouridine38-40 synthase